MQQQQQQQKRRRRRRRRRRTRTRTRTTSCPSEKLAEGAASSETVSDFTQAVIHQQAVNGEGSQQSLMSSRVGRSRGQESTTTTERRRRNYTKGKRRRVLFQVSTTGGNINCVPEKSFPKPFFELNRRVQGDMVALFRSLMLDVKAKAVVDLIKQYSNYSLNKPFRYVVTIA